MEVPTLDFSHQGAPQPKIYHKIQRSYTTENKQFESYN